MMVHVQTCLVRDIFQLLIYVPFFYLLQIITFLKYYKQLSSLEILRKKKTCFFLNHYLFYFSITTEQKMWLKSLYCFHFIVFSDNNFGKSFQDALSGKQSYGGSWYKYANDTIPRWPTSAVFWNSLIADRQHQGRHTRS